VTTVSYELAGDPLKITKVTDPYDRSALFEYDESGRLVKIADVIGITSEFEYGVNYEYVSSTMDFIRALTTPYGTTTFHGRRHPIHPRRNDPDGERPVDRVWRDDHPSGRSHAEGEGV